MHATNKQRSGPVFGVFVLLVHGMHVLDGTHKSVVITQLLTKHK